MRVNRNVCRCCESYRPIVSMVNAWWCFRLGKYNALLYENDCVSSFYNLVPYGCSMNIEQMLASQEAI